MSISSFNLSRYALSPAFLSQYRINEDLGTGGFGFVCSAFRTIDFNQVAVKFILKTKIPASGWARDHVLGIIPLECYFVKHIHHPNIIKFIDYFEDDNFAYLITELHGSPWNSTSSNAMTLQQSNIPLPLTPTSPIQENQMIPDPIVNQSRPKTPPISPIALPAMKRNSSCDLFECIEQHRFLSEGKAKYIFRQIVSAIYFLHMNGVVHRDIKDENILIDAKYNVKLIDFGSSSFIPTSREKFFDRFLGTLQYASPEIFKGEKYRGPESEVWSLGCCLYIMLTGSVPFETPMHAIHSPFHVTRELERMSVEGFELLNWMLVKDANKRPNIQQVYAHPWLA